MFIFSVSPPSGRSDRTARMQVNVLEVEDSSLHVPAASRTLHTFISDYVDDLWAYAILIHTHTHLVADICLLPFVFQRMQLGV